jgi:hypothetical protein
MGDAVLSPHQIDAGAPPPTSRALIPLIPSPRQSCHFASAADDMVFTRYYPVLRAAKGERCGRVVIAAACQHREGQRAEDGVRSVECGEATGRLPSVYLADISPGSLPHERVPAFSQSCFLPGIA